MNESSSSAAFVRRARSERVRFECFLSTVHALSGRLYEPASRRRATAVAVTVAAAAGAVAKLQAKLSSAEATEQRRQPLACRVCLTCARPSCGGASGRLRAATSAATATAASYTALNTCGQLGTPPASLFFPWPSTSASDWAKCHGNFLIITGPIERDTRCEKCQRQRQRRRQRRRQRQRR